MPASAGFNERSEKLQRKTDVAHEATEIFQVVLIGAASAWVVDIGEPFRRCRHCGQAAGTRRRSDGVHQ